MRKILILHYCETRVIVFVMMIGSMSYNCLFVFQVSSPRTQAAVKTIMNLDPAKLTMETGKPSLEQEGSKRKGLKRQAPAQTSSQPAGSQRMYKLPLHGQAQKGQESGPGAMKVRVDTDV